MKKIFTIFILLFMFITSAQSVFADNVIPVNNPITVPNLLYLLLSALNEHNYLIEEIQFKTGSVLFKVSTKEFIASVSSKDGYNSFIKIVPADNNYNFSPVLLQKLHNYIEANNKINFQKIM